MPKLQLSLKKKKKRKKLLIAEFQIAMKSYSSYWITEHQEGGKGVSFCYMEFSALWGETKKLDLFRPEGKKQKRVMWLRFRVVKAVDKVSSELQFYITRTRTPMVKQAGDQFNTDQVLLEQAVMGRWRQYQQVQKCKLMDS